MMEIVRNSLMAYQVSTDGQSIQFTAPSFLVFDYKTTGHRLQPAPVNESKLLAFTGSFGSFN